MTTWPMYAICRCGWRSETRPTPLQANDLAERHHFDTGHPIPALKSEMQVDGIDAKWINNNQPADVVVMRCTECGWKLSMTAADPPIPLGDPRLSCPHR